MQRNCTSSYAGKAPKDTGVLKNEAYGYFLAFEGIMLNISSNSANINVK